MFYLKSFRGDGLNFTLIRKHVETEIKIFNNLSYHYVAHESVNCRSIDVLCNQMSFYFVNTYEKLKYYSYKLRNMLYICNKWIYIPFKVFSEFWKLIGFISDIKYFYTNTYHWYNYIWSQTTTINLRMVRTLYVYPTERN